MGAHSTTTWTITAAAGSKPSTPTNRSSRTPRFPSLSLGSPPAFTTTLTSPQSELRHRPVVDLGQVDSSKTGRRFQPGAPHRHREPDNGANSLRKSSIPSFLNSGEIGSALLVKFLFAETSQYYVWLQFFNPLPIVVKSRSGIVKIALREFLGNKSSMRHYHNLCVSNNIFSEISFVHVYYLVQFESEYDQNGFIMGVVTEGQGHSRRQDLCRYMLSFY